MNIFVFIADSWGVTGGGINSFNFDFVQACAKVISNDKYDCIVCCVVPNLSDKICTEMRKKKIFPITLLNSEFHSVEATDTIINHFKNNSDFKKYFSKCCNVFWIGHDIYTGNIAEQCALNFNGWSIIFHHMDYTSYYIYKNPNVLDYQNKINLQKSILCSADLLCAVGPKLKKSAEDIIRVKKELKVLEVFPGISKCNAIEIPANRFNPIVFGRVENNNQKVKQIRLAVNAFALAIAKDKFLNIIGDDPTLFVIGYSVKDDNGLKQEIACLNKDATNIAGKLCNIIPMPYILNRKELLETISEASVAMMLSLHEGFGLVGYEAIAAGIPVIISKNSGLYEFLDNQKLSHLVYGVDIEGSSEKCGYSDNDIKIVSNALLEIRKDEKKYKQDALELRKTLIDNQNIYSWNAVAKNFIDNVLIEFRNETTNNEKIFYQLSDIMPLSISIIDKKLNADCLKGAKEKCVFSVVGNNALHLLKMYLQENELSKKYQILIYNISQILGNDNIDIAYEEFITDCQSYFESAMTTNSLSWFVLNELPKKLDKHILILNNFPNATSDNFTNFFSILESRGINCLIFTIRDPLYSENVEINPYFKENDLSHHNSCFLEQSQLTFSQQLLIKILAHCKRPYSKKMIKNICNSINWNASQSYCNLIFEQIADDENTLLKIGLIEEFSKYSYQNTKQLFEVVNDLKIDMTLYALGIYELGCYYARCYHYNKNNDPQLNWGFTSCSYLHDAVKIDDKIKYKAKLVYESVLYDIRYKCMRTSQYYRYIKSIRDFLETFGEPDNLWIWYSLIHCESIIQPTENILQTAQALLESKIKKLNLDEFQNAELYIQFVRLCAELENDLGYPDTLERLLEQTKLINSDKRAGNAWSQYIATLIMIAIDCDRYNLASRYIAILKKMTKPNNQYPWVNSCALEITLKIVKFNKGKIKKLNRDLSRLKRAYKIACYNLHDSRSQSWINGLWGEYLLLLGDQSGEQKIRCSLVARNKSGETTKSYRDWLKRISEMELSSKVKNLLNEEIERTNNSVL